MRMFFCAFVKFFVPLPLPSRVAGPDPRGERQNGLVLLLGLAEWILSGLDVRERDGAHHYLFLPSTFLEACMKQGREMKDFLPHTYRRIRGIC